MNGPLLTKIGKCIKLLNLTLLFVCSGATWAQTQNVKEVKGTVIDAKEQVALPGVTVAVKGTTTGVITNADGEFSIQVSPSDILIFSYIGI